MADESTLAMIALAMIIGGLVVFLLMPSNQEGKAPKTEDSKSETNTPVGSEKKKKKKNKKKKKSTVEPEEKEEEEESNSETPEAPENAAPSKSKKKKRRVGRLLNKGMRKRRLPLRRLFQFLSAIKES
eukprot:m.11268 g.11268  ORF g.11268 m.11268 type:complete len:128 (-) comp4409_c0_seq1:994-1377(-)